MSDVLDRMQRVSARLDALRAVEELERGVRVASTAADRETLRYHLEGVTAVVLPRFPSLAPRLDAVRAKVNR